MENIIDSVIIEFEFNFLFPEDDEIGTNEVEGISIKYKIDVLDTYEVFDKKWVEKCKLTNEFSDKLDLKYGTQYYEYDYHGMRQYFMPKLKYPSHIQSNVLDWYNFFKYNLNLEISDLQGPFIEDIIST